MDKPLWVVFSEVGVDGDDRSRVFSVGAASIKPGMTFTPCAKVPTSFCVLSVHGTQEEAQREYLRVIEREDDQ